MVELSIRRIHQLNTTYQPFTPNIAYSIQTVNTAYSVVHDKEFEQRSHPTFDEPERDFHLNLKLFKTSSLDYSNSLEFDLFSEYEEQSEEEVTETITEPTMEEYMTKTREGYGSGIVRPKIEEKDHFELKGQFLKELRDNTFSRSDNEDANEHIEKVLEIVELFHIPNITQDQVMLRAFLMSLTEAASR
ncbi:hypothetical protein Tco_1034223 [Tanacetum coccineum]